MNQATVTGVRVGVYDVPTDQHEADGTLAWDKTTLVIVEVDAGDLSGLGYTYATGACKPLIDEVLAGVVRGRSAMDVSGTWEAMVRTVRNIGRPGVASCAISAVDAALWDLKAKLLDLPLCRLLGVIHPEVPIYGSGGFTSYDEATTRAQVERWVQEWRIPRVKIKIGESWGHDVERDLERVALTRRLAGTETEVYVDANGGYTRKQALRVASALEDHDVTWFEEPVSSDDLEGLSEIRAQTSIDVTAGEYGYSLVYFEHMIRAGAVDCVQVDVTRCGGITEWVRVAALAAAAGLDVSGHCAPHLHAHVAAAVPNLRHVEYFHDHVRIEGLLFDGALEPTGGSLRPDQGRAGLGLQLKTADAEPYRVG